MHGKWIAIRASAVLAIIGSLATLVTGGMMLFAMLVAPPTGPAASPFPLKAFGIATAAMCASLAAWGICTAIAIFRRRGWARISIMVFAALLTFMGACGALVIPFVPMPTPEGVDQRLMDATRWGMAGFYGLLAAIGVWWLVLFYLIFSQEEFTPTPPADPSRPPLAEC